MFKKILVILAIFSSSGFMTANAAALFFSPSSQSVAVGKESIVDIILSGSSNEILNGYDLTITFDSEILQFNGGSFFGTNLAPEFDDSIVNQISWKDITGDKSHDLGDGNFRLASFLFQGLAVGTSELSFSAVDLTGLNATTTTGSITVIPEPGTMLLLGLGALGMRIAAKRNHTLATNQHA